MKQKRKTVPTLSKRKLLKAISECINTPVVPEIELRTRPLWAGNQVSELRFIWPLWSIRQGNLIDSASLKILETKLRVMIPSIGVLWIGVTADELTIWTQVAVVLNRRSL